MRRGLLRAGLTAFLLLGLIGLAAVACDGGDGGTATPAAAEPRIVFYSDRGGNDDIYIMELDGSGVVQLTTEPGRDYEPDAAPDGRTLVFASNRDDPNNSQLYLMGVDGSEVRRLTFSANGGRVIDDYAHWSPDGRHIVFQRTTIPEGERPDADIWMIDTENGEETQLTDTPEDWDSTPSFAADGESVLFESDRDGDFEIYRLDLETMELTQLTDAPGTDSEAKESPDGTQIAFTSVRDGQFRIYLMDPDGGNVRPLTESGVENRCPQWSPDGTRLTFYSTRDGDGEIYLINVDGSGETRITNSPGKDEIPDWVPAS
jgi:Tol biopolymer transport system component